MTLASLMTGCLIHTAIILSFTAQSYFFLIRQETDSEAACVDFLEDQAVCYAAVKEDVVWSILSPPCRVSFTLLCHGLVFICKTCY